MKEILTKLVELGDYVLKEIVSLLKQHNENEDARGNDLSNQLGQLYRTLEKRMEDRRKRLKELGLVEESFISNSFLLRQEFGNQAKAKDNIPKPPLVPSDNTTGNDILEGLGLIRDIYIREAIQENLKVIANNGIIRRAELLDKVNDTIELLN